MNINSTCTCKQKQIKNKYYGSCHMAVNDLIITTKNNIFKHVIIGYGIYCFCQQSCLFIRHYEYIITGNMKLLLSVSGKTGLVWS